MDCDVTSDNKCSSPIQQDDNCEQRQQQFVDASNDQLEDYASEFRSLMSSGLPYTALPLTEVFDFLYIGNKIDACNDELLQRVGITHVINCVTRYCRTGHEFYGKKIQRYHEFDAEDDPTYDMMQHFDAVYDVIEDARTKGGRAFIHCEMGINRSGTLIVAYAMVYNNWDPITAALYVKNRRKWLLSNTNFQLQLIKFALAKNLVVLRQQETDQESI